MKKKIIYLVTIGKIGVPYKRYNHQMEVRLQYWF